MDLDSMAKRVAGETARVVVTESPNRVEVTLRGRKHSGTWTDADGESGDDGDVSPDEGSDGMLLHSAMLAWGGRPEEDIAVEDLEGQGYWTDRPDGAPPAPPSWDPVAGDLFNAEYRRSGPGKHEIEEMRSDEQYEEAVVSVVMDAYNGWASKNGLPRFDALPAEEQVRAAVKALQDGDYGWYRGRLPDPEVVRRSIDAWS